MCMTKRMVRPNLEALRASTKTTLVWKKRRLRQGYKALDEFTDYVKLCDELIEGQEFLINVEKEKDIVDLKRIERLERNIKSAQDKKEFCNSKIATLKQALTELEDEVFEIISCNGKYLTRDDMIQLTGGHYYNFDKADEDKDSDGTFLDYVFVHCVERIDIKTQDELDFDLRQDGPLFYACMKAICRKDKDHTVFYGALGMLQEQQEQQRIEELENKYEVDGKIITLK